MWNFSEQILARNQKEFLTARAAKDMEERFLSHWMGEGGFQLFDILVLKDCLPWTVFLFIQLTPFTGSLL